MSVHDAIVRREKILMHAAQIRPCDAAMKTDTVISLLLNKILTIDEIMSDEILYYEDVQDRLQEYEDKGISYLPLRNGKECYHLEHKKVVPIALEQIIPPYTRLFDEGLKEKFRTHEVLFVSYYGSLQGMVHFSDYNRDAAMIYCYGVLLELERTLRRFLTKKGFTNADVVAYFQSSPKSYDDFKRRHRQKPDADDRDVLDAVDTFEPFQSFFLSEVIWFIQHLVKQKKIDAPLRLKEDVTAFRNIIMHAKYPIPNDGDADEDGLIYRYEDYANLMDTVAHIHDVIKNVQRLSR